MRIMKLIAGTTAAFLGLSLTMAGTASAAAGTWVPYGNDNPIIGSPATWKCAGSRTVATNVIAQVCAIRSKSGGSVQGAVIVRNNRSGLFSTTAEMDLQDVNSGSELGLWSCASSGVAANSWSVCFGKTIAWGQTVNSAGWAKGVYLGISGNV